MDRLPAVDVIEAAQMLGVTKSRVHQLIEQRELHVYVYRPPNKRGLPSNRTKVAVTLDSIERRLEWQKLARERSAENVQLHNRRKPTLPPIPPPRYDNE
jgi:hypothetical protein